MVRKGRTVTAIEVKSGRTPDTLPGLDRFVQMFPNSRTLLVGRGGITVEEFLSRPVAHWISGTCA